MTDTSSCSITDAGSSGRTGSNTTFTETHHEVSSTSTAISGSSVNFGLYSYSSTSSSTTGYQLSGGNGSTTSVADTPNTSSSTSGSIPSGVSYSEISSLPTPYSQIAPYIIGQTRGTGTAIHEGTGFGPGGANSEPDLFQLAGWQATFNLIHSNDLDKIVVGLNTSSQFAINEGYPDTAWQPKPSQIGRRRAVVVPPPPKAPVAASATKTGSTIGPVAPGAQSANPAYYVNAPSGPVGAVGPSTGTYQSETTRGNNGSQGAFLPLLSDGTEPPSAKNLKFVLGQDMPRATTLPMRPSESSGFQLTFLGYREDFRKATPSMPKDWPVHHTLQQALRDRYAKMKVNVDDPVYLRGVPPEVHPEITRIQNAWFEEEMRRLGLLRPDETLASIPDQGRRLKKLYQRMDLKRYEAMAADIERVYGKLFLKAGEGKKAVDRIKKELGNVSHWKLGKGARLAKFGDKISKFANLAAIFGVIAQGLNTTNGIANPNQQQRDALSDFEFQYRKVLENLLAGNDPPPNYYHDLRTAFIAYLQAIGVDSTTVDLLNGSMGAAIDSNLHP